MKAAFSLLEVLVATAFLGVLATITIPILSSISRVEGAAVDRASAQAILRDPSLWGLAAGQHALGDRPRWRLVITDLPSRPVSGIHKDWILLQIIGADSSGRIAWTIRRRTSASPSGSGP